MQIQDFVKAYEGRPDEELVQLAAALALLCRIKFGTSRMRSLSEFWEFTESTKLRITALFISNMEMRLDDSALAAPPLHEVVLPKDGGA